MNDENQQPLATYRLQLNGQFRFEDAQALVPYLSRLGVTHAYCSPILRARQGTTHGYDVVDPMTLNPGLGDEPAFRELVATLRNYGLGLVLDIVPNHMAASIENPYWRDVLTYGPSSPFARWFDIDWRMPDPDLWGRVLVPVLGKSLPRVLESDEIHVAWSEGRFVVRYFEHLFPVDPATVPSICRFGLDELGQPLEQGDPALAQMNDILKRLQGLPKLAVRVRRHVQISRDETEGWLAQLAQLFAQSPRVHQWAEQTAERFGAGESGRGRLRKLLEAQPYRLVHWRAAARVINYRRFFDINELISVRQEDPQVFDETHSAIRRWTHEGLIDALRIDHIDGLRDPLGYLERLVETVAMGGRRQRPVAIYIEKILAHGEKLPSGWPVAGTTGYDFLNQVENCFVSSEGFAQIEQQYRQMLRRPVRFKQVASWGKRRVLRDELSPHVGRLAEILLRFCRRQQSAGHTTYAAAGEPAGEAAALAPAPVAIAERYELTKRELVDALVEVIVALPIYRTYIDSNHCTISDADRRYLEAALDGARRAGRAAPEAIDFLRQVLLLDGPVDMPEDEVRERIRFIQRFQQLTGPAAAKGIEDTALYAYVPLVSLCEVGGEPDVALESALAEFHQANADRAATWPRAMLCATTHDTKRTADVRARLDVLSELPRLWTGRVRMWRRKNQPHRTRVRGKLAPDPATEYLLYQTVVGIWPAPRPSDAAGQLPAPDRLQELRERIEQYMLKAVREAKIRTSWTDNTREYEDALLSFVRSLFLDDGGDGPSFLADVQNFVGRIARAGFWNSLARTLIQFTAPGVPDLYQGDELWNFALVDPDNRRAVDYECRKALLDEVVTGFESEQQSRRAFVRELVDGCEDGRIKLHLIRSALSARRHRPALLASSQYLPLEVQGARCQHVLAFAREAAEQAAVVVVPRLTATLVAEPAQPPIGRDVWGDTVIRLPEQLSQRGWQCALSREERAASQERMLRVAELLDCFPAALLLSS